MISSCLRRKSNEKQTNFPIEFEIGLSAGVS